MHKHARKHYKHMHKHYMHMHKRTTNLHSVHPRTFSRVFTLPAGYDCVVGMGQVRHNSTLFLITTTALYAGHAASSTDNMTEVPSTRTALNMTHTTRHAIPSDKSTPPPGPRSAFHCEPECVLRSRVVPPRTPHGHGVAASRSFGAVLGRRQTDARDRGGLQIRAGWVRVCRGNPMRDLCEGISVHVDGDDWCL